MPFGVDLPKVPEPQEVVDQVTDFVEDAADTGTQAANEVIDFLEYESELSESILLGGVRHFLGSLDWLIGQIDTEPDQA